MHVHGSDLAQSRAFSFRSYLSKKFDGSKDSLTGGMAIEEISLRP